MSSHVKISKKHNNKVKNRAIRKLIVKRKLEDFLQKLWVEYIIAEYEEGNRISDFKFINC